MEGKGAELLAYEITKAAVRYFCFKNIFGSRQGGPIATFQRVRSWNSQPRGELSVCGQVDEHTMIVSFTGIVGNSGAAALTWKTEGAGNRLISFNYSVTSGSNPKVKIERRKITVH